jgi:hypothetical protein
MEISKVLNPNPGGSWTAYLILKVEFYVWDNVNNKIISFGIVDHYETIPIVLTRDTWKFAIREVAQKIVSPGPFKTYIRLEG